MDKEKVFHHYSSILDNLLDNSEYYKIYFQGCYALEDDEQIFDNLSLVTGLYRACLIDSNYDYVIKIPFEKSLDNECEREISIYNEAFNKGIENFFARPEFIGWYSKTICAYKAEDAESLKVWQNKEEFFELLPRIEEYCDKQRIIINIPLYAYPRAEFYNFNHYSKKSEHLAKKMDSPLREYNLAIFASFIEDYGKDLCNELTDFLYDYGISDLHLGNVGSIDNRICIIDYAG